MKFSTRSSDLSPELDGDRCELFVSGALGARMVAEWRPQCANQLLVQPPVTRNVEKGVAMVALTAIIAPGGLFALICWKFGQPLPHAFLPSFLPLLPGAWAVGALRSAVPNLKRRFGALAVLPIPDVPSPTRQFPSEITLRSDGTFLGQDVGWISFCDGFLHFHGSRTQFSLLAKDVDRPHPAWSARLALLFVQRSGAREPRQQLQFCWRDLGSDRTMLIRPVPWPGHNPLDLKRSLRGWVETRDERDEFRGTYPPNVASPELLFQMNKAIDAARRRLRLVLPVTALLTLETALLVSGTVERAVVFGAILTIAAVTATYFHLRTQDLLARLGSLPIQVTHHKKPL